MGKDEVRRKVVLLLQAYKETDPDGYLELIKQSIKNEYKKSNTVEKL